MIPVRVPDHVCMLLCYSRVNPSGIMHYKTGALLLAESSTGMRDIRVQTRSSSAQIATMQHSVLGALTGWHRFRSSQHY